MLRPLAVGAQHERPHAKERTRYDPAVAQVEAALIRTLRCPHCNRLDPAPPPLRGVRDERRRCTRGGSCSGWMKLTLEQVIVVDGIWEMTEAGTVAVGTVG